MPHPLFEEILTILSMPISKRFLFTHWEGGGNTPPMLAIVRRLLARGHEVCVLSDACNQTEVQATGASFAAWSRIAPRNDKSAASDPLKDWELKSPLALIARMRDRLFIGPALAFAEDVLDALTRFPADVIVTSEMLLGVMAAAEAARVPCVGISANIYLYPLHGVPPFGPGFQPAKGSLGRMRDAFVRNISLRVFGKGTSAFNAARRALGLPPLAHPFEQTTRIAKHLVLTSSAFDFPTSRLPGNVVYTGPEIEDPTWVEPWQSPWPPEDTRPLVLVGFSTTFQNHVAPLRRIIAALGSLQVRAVVTVGPALNISDLQTTDNVLVCRSAPHSQLLPHASAVITHAGHGTVIRSLAAGVPLLCMPMGRDQNDNAARVVARGAGLRISPNANVGTIRNAVAKLLKSPQYRISAQNLGREIRKDVQNSATISVLEGIAVGNHVEC